MQPRFFIFFVLAAHFIGSVSSLSCLNNEGKRVAWHFTYKMPNGYNVSYVDEYTPASRTSALELYERGLDNIHQPVALIRTLLALEGAHLATGSLNDNVNTTFADADATGRSRFLLYNDQPSSGPPASSSLGHTKGVLHVGKNGGFWLVHSTPRWPLNSNVKRFYFPEQEKIYGQTFLCISLDTADIDKVATQLLYNQPNVYYSSLTEADQKAHPQLKDVMSRKWVKGPATNTATIAGHFTSFAKNRKWGKDLYGDLVAPALKSDLLVESWMRGSAVGKLCKPKHRYQVTDVTELATKFGVEWTETQDHAKWAITLDGSSRVCVGDINRMTSQRKRGGGTVCFKNSALANRLANTVTKHDECK